MSVYYHAHTSHFCMTHSGILVPNATRCLKWVLGLCFLSEILFAFFLHHTLLIIPDFVTLIICRREYKLWKRLLSLVLLTLKDKDYLQLHINIQSVPHSKHTLSQFHKPFSQCRVFCNNRCPEIHTIKHLNTLCGHNEEFLNVKPVGT